MPKNCEFCGHAQGDTIDPRSLVQLRRYHAMIRAAYDNWPEAHEHQFANVHECRAWLQMKAGAREIGAQIPLAGMTKERAMMLAEASLRGGGSYAMPVMHGDVLVIFRPKSISFAKMTHHEFCRLSDAVEDVIRGVLGVDAEQLLAARAST